MAEGLEDGRDLQPSVGLSLLTELEGKGKITPDVAELFKGKFQRLHDTIVQSYGNHKQLWQRAKKLKADIVNEKNKLDLASNQQQDNQEILEKYSQTLRKAQSELEYIENRVQLLEIEFSDVDHEKNELVVKIKEDQNDMRQRIQPEVERTNAMIRELREDITRVEMKIENDLKYNGELKERVGNMKRDNGILQEEITQLHETYIKIKDDPIRFGKNADLLTGANLGMLKDLQNIKEEIDRKQKRIEEQTKEIDVRSSKMGEHEKTVRTIIDDIEKMKSYIQRVHNEAGGKRVESEGYLEQKYAVEIDVDGLRKEIKRTHESVNSLKKIIDTHKKEFNKERIAKNMLSEEIREFDVYLEKIKKEIDEINYEVTKQKEIAQNTGDDTTLLEGKRRDIEEGTKQKRMEFDQVKKKIDDYKKNLADMQAVESDAQKTVKNLTVMRESMARKASAALAEVKQTREELKIKELLILDLTKKHQETEFKLNSFKALYEEVKSARNKYVNMIQNTSQDLAELKERIKILQNELEIFKNESAEKDRTLMEYKHILQLEIHKRDRRHAKLNKLEYALKAKKEIVEQQINEIEKLNMVILSLEKEMFQLRHQYEVACESRNYTGIQLIDRNDELCILYEKANIQDNILRNGETEIKKLEDDVRMIKIEIAEIKRKIEVCRKQIGEVPHLSDDIVQLKNELNEEKNKERALAAELENPDNLNRWRELEGEDPDQEALEAKIQVLEERLNQKKEQLLEKELIIDELTTLSEKLRKEALEGRQSTLELSEKINEFQARLKDVTRKMMATIAELSMLQATAIKLQQERDEVEKVVDDARERTSKSLPPTPETEIEYLKMVRDKKRYEEARELRVQREAFEKSLPPFVTRTTAEHRVNAYIPDEIGIPKPYGQWAPFKPSDIGIQIRHFKKPVQKEVEI